MEQELAGLRPPVEAARLKGMTINGFLYHAGRPGAPAPVLVGVCRHPYYRPADVLAWRPRKRGKR